MKRQEFIDNILLSNKAEQAGELLKLRDSLRDFAQEEADLEEFAKNTRHFIIAKLVTPFGEHPVFVDKESLSDLNKYLKENQLTYPGITLE